MTRQREGPWARCATWGWVERGKTPVGEGVEAFRRKWEVRGKLHHPNKGDLSTTHQQFSLEDEQFPGWIHDFAKQPETQGLTPELGCVNSTVAFKLGFAVAVCFEGGCAHNYLNSPGSSSVSLVVYRSSKIGPPINFIRYRPLFFLVVGGGSEACLPSAQKETPYH